MVILNLEVCLQQFIKDYSFRYEPETVDLYQKAVRQMITYSGESYDLITSSDIRKWAIYLEENNYKAVTIKAKLSGLIVFYRYCVEEGFIKHNPMQSVQLPEIDESLPHYLQHEQLIQLRELVKTSTEERAIIEVLYATGVRISELANIKKEDINWSERTIHIPNGKRKKARIVLFTRSCAEYLESYLRTRLDSLPYVFVNTTGTDAACPRTIQKWFKKYSKILGMRMTPHTLRHTFAAHLAIRGMPLECIQELLGHDSPYQSQLYARLYNHARKLQYDELM